jgi:short-subunit dehydrogenase
MPDFPFKSAIVIGASSGIGRALALELLRGGIKVGITARRLHLLKEIQNQFPEKTFVREMDVLDTEKTAAQVRELIAEMGGIDLFIYNSGVDTRNPELDWRIDLEIAKVNALGFVAAADTALNYFREKGSGYFAGISSFVAIRGNGKSPVYSATKAFMSTYMRGLRQKLMHTAVKITDIRPGYINTDMIKNRKQAFWAVEPEEAAIPILNAIARQKKIAYIPKRWWFPALVLKCVPDFLYDIVYDRFFRED